MKKYIPSVKLNNEKKEIVIKEMKKVLFSLEKRRVSLKISESLINDVKNELKNALSDIENVIFTGTEDVSKLSEILLKKITDFKKSLLQDLENRVEANCDELLYYISSFVSVGNGEFEEFDGFNEAKRKVSWGRKILDKRLEELKEIKEVFVEQENRLEKEMEAYENDLSELEELMISEDNERKINELYRKITSTKSKIDMLNVRRSNYSACFNILDIVYANAQEIIVASDFSVEELSKAKALLNINRLKNVVSAPEKAITILKTMEKEIKTISEKVKVIDEKVFGLNFSQTNVSNEALKYKEELLKKKREKKLSEDELNNLSEGEININVIEEEI